jgi:cytochrome c-type biogenesis protein CcmH
MIARRVILVLTLAFAAVLALPGDAVGQKQWSERELDATVKSLASQLRCPVCQGVSIQDSPTELAYEMKAVIRQQLVDGSTPDEVKGYFVERYGEWVLLQPEMAGFNLIVYIAPLIILLFGLGYVYRTVRRWSAPEGSELAVADGSEE